MGLGIGEARGWQLILVGRMFSLRNWSATSSPKLDLWLSVESASLERRDASPRVLRAIFQPGWVSSLQPADGPALVYGRTPVLHPVGHVQGSPQVEVPSELTAAQPPSPRHGLREHESDMPFAVLNRERKAQAQRHH